MKPSLKIISVALLAAAVCGALLQRSALSNVRQENDKLSGESDEVRRLARENAEIERLSAENQEIEKLRLETRDLHKLRNEVHQLRERKPELERLRAENQRLHAATQSGQRSPSSAAAPASLVPKETLSDAGFGSPEATLQTFLWAVREGNLEKMRRCFPPETPDGQLPTMDDFSLAGFKGFRVIAKKVFSADEVKLGLQLSGEEGVTSQESALPFKRVGGEWKIGLKF